MSTNELGTPSSRVASIPKPSDGDFLTAASVNPALEGLMSAAMRTQQLSPTTGFARIIAAVSLPSLSTTYDTHAGSAVLHVPTWATSVRSSYLVTWIVRLVATTNPKVYTGQIVMGRDNANTGTPDLVKFGPVETFNCAVAGVSYEFVRQALISFSPLDAGGVSWRNGKFLGQVNTPAIAGGGTIEFSSFSIVSVFGDQLP